MNEERTYTLCWADEPAGLQEIVTTMMRDDPPWLPIGGPVVDRGQWYQAMILLPDEDRPDPGGAGRAKTTKRRPSIADYTAKRGA